MDARIVQTNKETLLHANQCSSGGILQAMLASIVTNPTATDTFKISDGTTTETFTFLAARNAAFEVEIGLTAAASQTNLIAAIVSDSTLWSAVATTTLGRYFAALYATQFMVYRKLQPSSGRPEADRIFGVQTAPAGIKVVSFGAYGYQPADATEANIPATDPAAKRFGFGRLVADLYGGEEHRVASGGQTYRWSGAAWRESTLEGTCGTPTQSTVAASATSVTLLSANYARRGATIANDSTAVLYLKLGATASTSSYSVQLGAADYYDVPFGYVGVVDGIWSSATGNARITELT